MINRETEKKSERDRDRYIETESQRDKRWVVTDIKKENEKKVRESEK